MLFQNTWPEASIRNSIGSGGSFAWGGGFRDFCGRSTSTGTDWIGMVTMKMINSTSSTSTRGVTLMSAIALPPALELNDISISPYGPFFGGVVTKPTLRMPWAWAIFTTSLTIRYLVVRSPRMLTVGCGVFCASTESRLSITWRVIG